MITRENNKGFTLVEVLVAIAIGAFLLSIVVTVFLGARATSKATTGIARSQESTRFASFFIDRDVRMAGYFGCSKEVSKRNWLDFTRPEYSPSIAEGIFGWEFTGTDVGDDYELDYEELGNDFTEAELSAARTDNTAPATNWTGNSIQGIPGTEVALDLPAAIAALEPLRGSDIIVTSISTPLLTRLTSTPNQRAPRLAVVDTSGVAAASDIDTGTMLQVGDCSSIDIFQNAAQPTEASLSIESGSAIGPGNRITGAFQWQKKWDESATVFETRTVVYFIGTGSGGTPALFSFSSTCGLSDSCGAVATELVDGVENMQILYGEDTNTEAFRNGVANIYRSANEVEDFRRVVSVKIGLIVRSPDPGLDVNEDTAFPEFTLLDQVTIDPPDDANQRFVNNTTVRLRNRGL